MILQDKRCKVEKKKAMLHTNYGALSDYILRKIALDKLI
jgi:hypothetical protein